MHLITSTTKMAQLLYECKVRLGKMLGIDGHYELNPT